LNELPRTREGCYPVRFALSDCPKIGQPEQFGKQTQYGPPHPTGNDWLVFFWLKMFLQDQLEKRVMSFYRSLCAGLTLDEMYLTQCVLCEEIAKREIKREVERKGYFFGFEKYAIQGLSCLKFEAKLALRGNTKEIGNPKVWRIEGFDDSLEDYLDHWFEVFECDGPPDGVFWKMEGDPKLADAEPGELLYTATGLTEVYVYWTPPALPLSGKYLVLFPGDLRATRVVYEAGAAAVEEPAARGAVTIVKEC
jgi:hypothetical protein